MKREMGKGLCAFALCVLLLPLGAAAQPAHTRADVEAQWSKFTTSYIRANLKVGKTTVDQVLQSFGDPHQHDQVLTDKVDKEYFLYFKNPPKRSARALLRVGSAFSNAAGAIVPSWRTKGTAYRAAHGMNEGARAASELERSYQGTWVDGPQGANKLLIEFNNGVVSGYRFSN